MPHILTFRLSKSKRFLKLIFFWHRPYIGCRRCPYTEVTEARRHGVFYGQPWRSSTRSTRSNPPQHPLLFPSTRSTRSTWLNKMFCIWPRMWLMKLEQSTAQIQLRVFVTLISPCLSAAGSLATRQFLVFISCLPWTEFGEEVHLERVGELRRRAEREVHILPQHLRDVRPRHLHPPRQLRLRHPQLLHPEKDSAKERRPYPIHCFHRPFKPNQSCLTPPTPTG